MKQMKNIVIQTVICRREFLGTVPNCEAKHIANVVGVDAPVDPQSTRFFTGGHGVPPLRMLN